MLPTVQVINLKFYAKNIYIFFKLYFLGERDHRYNQIPRRVCNPENIKNYYYENYLISLPWFSYLYNGNTTIYLPLIAVRILGVY